MEKLSSIFWFLSLPVFIYVCYRLCLLAVTSFEKLHSSDNDVKKEKIGH